MKNTYRSALLVATATTGGIIATPHATAQDLVTIDLLAAAPRMMAWYPLIVGETLGYFEEEGIRVNLLPTETNIPYVAFLQNGQADIAMLDGPQTFQAAASGIPINIIYEVVQREQGGLAVLADSDIMDISDLAGTTIGLGTDRDTATLAMALTVWDMTLDEVETVVIGEAIPVLTNALQSGAVDALAAGEAEWRPMEATGVELRRITPPEVTDVPGNNFAVSVDALDEMGDVFEGFLRAWSKGMAAAKINPEGVILMLQQDLPSEWENVEVGMRAFNSIMDRTSITETLGEIRHDVWNNMQDLMIAVDILDTTVDTSTFLNDSFIEVANDFDWDEVEAEIAAWVAENE